MIKKTGKENKFKTKEELKIVNEGKLGKEYKKKDIRIQMNLVNYIIS